MLAAQTVMASSVGPNPHQCLQTCQDHTGKKACEKNWVQFKDSLANAAILLILNSANIQKIFGENSINSSEKYITCIDFGPVSGAESTFMFFLSFSAKILAWSCQH